MLRSQTKYNCGLTVPSSCVPYTGKDLTILGSSEQLPCDANMNDVITAIDTKLKILQDANNFTTLNPRCLTFTPATVTNVQLHQLEVDEICAAKARLLTLETAINNLDIGSELISGVNLGCLAASAGPCEVGDNTYTARALYNIIFSTLCQLLGQ